MHFKRLLFIDFDSVAERVTKYRHEKLLFSLHAFGNENECMKEIVESLNCVLCKSASQTIEYIIKYIRD